MPSIYKRTLTSLQPNSKKDALNTLSMTSIWLRTSKILLNSCSTYYYLSILRTSTKWLVPKVRHRGLPLKQGPLITDGPGRNSNKMLNLLTGFGRMTLAFQR